MSHKEAPDSMISGVDWTFIGFIVNHVSIMKQFNG